MKRKAKLERMLPAALAPRSTGEGTWTIEECPMPPFGQPCVSAELRQLRAPAGNSIGARVVRTHELTHALISPTSDERKGLLKRVRGIKASHLAAIEEARVAAYQERSGAFTRADLLAASKETGETAPIEEQVTQALRLGMRPDEVCERVIVAHGRGLEIPPRMLDPAARIICESAGRIVAKLRAGTGPAGIAALGDPSYRAALRELTTLADRVEEERTRERREREMAEGMEEIKELLPADMRDSARLGLALKGSGASFGTMRVEELERTVPCRKRVYGSRAVIPPSGVLAYPSRYAPRIGRFRISKRTEREAGGAGMLFLVDCSCSMSWDGEALAALLRELPAAIVACYAGEDGHGTLSIVSRGGMRANDATLADAILRLCSMGGNEVDLPALEWATEQRAARIVWVSDGEACARGSNHAECVVACARFCAAHGIKRVLTQEPEELLAAL